MPTVYSETEATEVVLEWLEAAPMDVTTMLITDQALIDFYKTQIANGSKSM